MIGRKRTLIPIALLVMLAATAPPAAANHWCAQTAISVVPGNPVATRATTFTVTVANTGLDTTQLSAVQVKFSWEGTWHSAGGGTILAGQSQTFAVSATAPSAGAYQVEVKVTATSSGDVLHESSDCSATIAVSATQPSPGFGAGFVAVAVGAAGVLVMGTRRRRRKGR